MSMPNRFCVIERRLDIIEKKLGIKNSDKLLYRQVLPKEFQDIQEDKDE